MSREIRADYNQSFLLPPSLEEWVAPDHPVRFIRDFVAGCDLEAAGFRAYEGAMGRPHYANDLLLSVWIYGYMEQIRSARKLEHACRTHMPLLWLTGMHVPDHNTLWRFWWNNQDAVKHVFKQSVRVAHEMGLVGMVTHALDGTRIAVHSSPSTALHRDTLEKLDAALDESIAELESMLEAADDDVDAPEALPEELQNAKERKRAIKEALETLDAEDAKRIMPSESEARMMTSRGRTNWAYNAQAVVDDETGIVVAEDVVNEATDYMQAEPMMNHVEANTGGAAQCTVADAGYRNIGQQARAHKRGHTVITPKHGNETDDGNPYHKSHFTYDEDADHYTCPRGEKLPYSHTKKPKGNRQADRIYRCRSYKDCPVREQCSSAKYGRTVVQHVHYKFQQWLDARRDDPEIQTLLAQRKAIIEPLFGWIKRNDGFRRWTAPGLTHARAQWSMLCTAINLKKIYNKWKATTPPTPKKNDKTTTGQLTIANSSALRAL